MVATTLRGKGQSVDLVLESKPLKWYQAPSFYCETFTSYLINLSGILSIFLLGCSNGLHG